MAASPAMRSQFIHVPKCAGASVIRLLDREYGDAAVFRFYGDVGARLEALQALPVGQRREFAAFGGHLPYGLEPVVGGPLQAFAMLRHPVDRVVSHYFYVLERTDLAGRDRLLDGVNSLDDYVTRSPAAGLINNGMTRFLGQTLLDNLQPATATDLDTACRRVNEGQILVGLHERFLESIAVFAHTFGWRRPVGSRVNETTNRPAVASLDPRTIQLIEDHNAMDLALYQIARARFDVQTTAIPELEKTLRAIRIRSAFPRRTRR